MQNFTSMAATTANDLLIGLFEESRDISQRNSLLLSIHHLGLAFPHKKMGIRIKKCPVCNCFPVVYEDNGDISLLCHCHDTPVFTEEEGERLLRTWNIYTNRKEHF